MSSLSVHSKRSGGSKGGTFNPNGQRNVDSKFKRTALVKLYALIAVLVLTLGLIAILEYAQRSLPGASKSHFNPFETGTRSSASTTIQSQASEKTSFVTLTKRQLAPPGSTPVAPGSTPVAPGSTPVAPASVSLPPVPASSPPPLPISSTSSVPAPPPPAISSPPLLAPAASPSPPEPSSSSSLPPLGFQPCTPGNTALSCISPSTSTSASPNTTLPAPPVVNPGGSPTDIFVPVVVSSTVAAAACTATAASSPSCTCPQNSEIPNCRCTPDPAVDICQCTFKTDVNGIEYQDCVCSPDTCTTCRAPFSSNGGSSFLAAAACPSVPFEAGCVCSSTGATEACANTVRCTCGTTVRAAQCANSTVPAPPPAGVILIGTTLVTNVTTPAVTANVTSPAETGNVTTPAGTANATSPAGTANGTSPILAPAVPPANITSSIPAGAVFGGLGGTSIFTTRVTPAILIPITSSSTTSGPNGQRVISVVITPGSRPATPVTVPPSVSTQGQPISVAPGPPNIPQNIATQVISRSVGTNSAGQPTTAVITLSPATPVISFSVGTDSAGQPTTVPVTLNPANAGPSGAVFFVSNSISTSAGTPIAVAVTLFTAIVDPSSPVVTGLSGQIFTVPTALLQTEASLTPTIIPASHTTAPSSSTGPGSNGRGGSNGGSSSSVPVKVAVFAWPKSKTFLGGYLPVLVAKLYQMGWTSIHNQAQDLAPFNNPSIGTLFGGPDSMSLFTLAPYLVSWAIIPFASDSIFFDTNYGCANPNPATPANPCWPPKMTANTWVIRLLQGFLSVTAAFALALIALWFKKPHGASNDPTSIAAVAAIASHPRVIRDFSCPIEATSKELKTSLKGKKYHLDKYQAANGTLRYGMVPKLTEPTLSQTTPATQPSKIKALFNAGWKTTELIKDVVYLVYLFAILAITSAYLRDIDKSPFAKMLEGSTVGRRIVFAVLAAIASAYFSAIERDMQTLAPYMDLQHLNATPTPTILLRKHTLPLTSFIPMLRNRHFVPAVVAFVAILSEFLVITLSGLPYRPGQLRSEFYFCAISSLVILLLMLAIVVVINVWRRFLPHLPRQPNTVASVLSYVVGTRMCDDFEGLERLKVADRDKRIRALGKRYGYGKREVDGVERWIVDEGASREPEDGLMVQSREEGVKNESVRESESVGSSPGAMQYR